MSNSKASEDTPKSIKLATPKSTTSADTNNDYDGAFNEEERKDWFLSKNVITSARTCAWFLAKRNIRKPFVICSSTALLEELESVGINDYVATMHRSGQAREDYMQAVSPEKIADLIRQAPDVDAVVVGWDQTFSAMKIAVAVQYLRWNEELPLISCSMDPSGILGKTPKDFPGFGEQKLFAVGNGAMTHSICESTGRVAISVGKPSEILLEQLRRPLDEQGFGVDSSKTVVVGSTLETDILMANMGGMKSLLVLTGVASRSDAENEQNPLQMPTWVLDSFADV